MLRLVFCLLLSVQALAAGPSAELTRTLDRIFNKKEFDPKEFGPARWIEQGAAYTALENGEIVRYETATEKRSVLVAVAKLVPSPGGKALNVDDYQWSTDNQRLLVYTNTKKVWRQNTRGDYWVLDLAAGKFKKLGGDAPESSLMFAKFAPDGRSVAYVRANNIYVEDLAGGKIRPLTKDGSATTINGTSDWVNEEELDIRDGFTWSPDGQSIAYWQFDTTGVAEFTLINDTEQQYPVLHKFAYPMPGGRNSAVRVGVVNVGSGRTKWMAIPGDSRNYYIARIAWAANSGELALEHLNRLQNTNQVWLADVRSGAVRKLFEDIDKAWVDVVDEIRWFNEGKSFLWLSERDGWRRAYAVPRNGGEAKAISSARADVMQIVAVDSRGGWLYYIASPSNATQRYLYRARLDGSGSPERVTPQNQAGTHTYDISPDGRWAIHNGSSFDHPPVTELVSLPDHKTVRTLEANTDLAGKVKELVSSHVEFFQVDVSGGVKMDGYMIKPPGFDPVKKYPVLVYVYGEVAGVTATDAWQGSRGLFHRAVANEGYLVVSYDVQGTPAPKGRDWRKIVYGSLGPSSVKQEAEGIRQLLAERPYMDGSRMAIWGWSGGGSNTLNVMLRSPGLFAVGMSVAPVADQRYYDTIYQEHYMGLPVDNATGYRDGSAINFAPNLAGKLLIVHGSGDDNVHYQGTELLVNKLIELGRPFDMMVYPNRTHAINEGAGTSFHLYSLLARYLEEHIVPGGVPR